MAEIGIVVCYGKTAVPDHWVSKVAHAISRLYYIHSGTGGYTERGAYHPFLPGYLYYLPPLADVDLSFDPTDRLVHTYCNFERIPPIVSERVLAFDPRGDARAEAATAVFLAGGEERMRRGAVSSNALSDDSFTLFALESVSYLTERIAQENGASEVRDARMIGVLRELHRRMAEPLTVGELASSVFMTDDAFIRCFKRALGMTPYAYLRRLRLCIARQLKSEGKSFEQVAREVGYSDAASLYHALAAEAKR